MSENIISLSAERDRRQPKKQPPAYSFSVDVYGTKYPDLDATLRGFALDDGLAEPDRMRAFAKALEHLARCLRDQAHEVEPDDDGWCLATYSIFESSRVSSWISNKVATPEQVDWLVERLDDAKCLASPALLTDGGRDEG